MLGLERLLGPMANAVLEHRRNFDKEHGNSEHLTASQSHQKADYSIHCKMAG